MTAQSCSGVREEAAVALLSGEPLPDGVRAHHRTCAGCREDYARLAALSALLDGTREDTAPPVAVPDEAALRRTLADLAHGRRRRRRQLALVAAAVVALVLLAGFLLTGSSHRPPAVTPVGDVLVAEGTTQDGASPAGADVHVLAHGAERGGVLVVRPWGLAGGVVCRIELVDASGWTHPVTTWRIPPGYERGWQARVTVSVAPKEVRTVRFVDDATGAVLLAVPVHAA